MPTRLVQVALINHCRYPVRWLDDFRPSGFWQDPWYPSNFTDLKPGEMAVWRQESGSYVGGVEGKAIFKIDIPPTWKDRTEFITLWWEKQVVGGFHKSVEMSQSPPPGNDFRNQGPRLTWFRDLGARVMGSSENLGELIGDAIAAPPIFGEIPRNHMTWSVELINTDVADSTLPITVPRQQIGDIDAEIRDIGSSIAETGVFLFTRENGGLCREGSWSYQRTLHEQVIIATVEKRAVDVEWYLENTKLISNSGVLSINTICQWPFPLADGRSESKSVQVKYEITVEENKSTLKLYNNPADGSYYVMVAIKAVANGRNIFNDYRCRFYGESCDFDSELLRKEEACIRRYSDLSTEKAKSRIPGLGEPEITFNEDLWRFVGDGRFEVVESLQEIIKHNLRDNPEMASRAVKQLEREINIGGKQQRRRR